jgi:hypothetical protein
MLHPMYRCSVTVQPAGSAGKRHVFMTRSGNGEKGKDIHIDVVMSEQTADELGAALVSGSKGLMRQVDF